MHEDLGVICPPSLRRDQTRDCCGDIYDARLLCSGHYRPQILQSERCITTKKKAVGNWALGEVKEVNNVSFLSQGHRSRARAVIESAKTDVVTLAFLPNTCRSNQIQQRRCSSRANGENRALGGGGQSDVDYRLHGKDSVSSRARSPALLSFWLVWTGSSLCTPGSSAKTAEHLHARTLPAASSATDFMGHCARC